MLWCHLRKAVHAGKRSNMAELHFSKDELANISCQLEERVPASYPTLLIPVDAANGAQPGLRAEHFVTQGHVRLDFFAPSMTITFILKRHLLLNFFCL